MQTQGEVEIARFFLGSDEAKHIWLEEKVETWVAGAKHLVGFLTASPQMAYDGLAMLL